MPPILALILSIALITLLYVRDRRTNQDVSSALWVPLLWLIFIGTRFPSQWLDLGRPSQMDNADQYLDGSPVDQLVLGLLYGIGLAILIHRRLAWGKFVLSNLWIAAFLLYALLSILWSEYQWTSIKRYIKVLEHVVMVLVVLTESNQAQAFDALLRRFLTFAIVFSVLFLKYYPEIGRGFDKWSGTAVNFGITTDKNALGHVCFLGSVFFFSSLVFRPHREIGRRLRFQWLVDVLMLAAVFWLVETANAKTALVSSIIGMVCVLLCAKTALGRRPGWLLMTVLLVAGLAALLESTLQLREASFELLGREATLTDRTYVWEDVLAIPINSLIGTGFESFWLGPRIEALWQKYWWQPNQAHNGYIETYLNLGTVGLALLVAMMLASFMRALATLPADPIGPIRFALLLGIAIYNYTDATFKAVHILYFMFFLLSLSGPRTAVVERTDVQIRTPRETHPRSANLTGP